MEALSENAPLNVAQEVVFELVEVLAYIDRVADLDGGMWMVYHKSAGTEIAVL